VLTGNMWFSRTVLGLVGGLVSNSFGGEFSGGPIINTATISMSAVACYSISFGQLL
jgi:hypothetical protein